MTEKVDISVLQGWLFKFKSKKFFGAQSNKRWFSVDYAQGQVGSKGELALCYYRNRPPPNNPRGWIYFKDIIKLKCYEDTIEIYSSCLNWRLQAKTTAEHRLWSKGLQKIYKEITSSNVVCIEPSPRAILKIPEKSVNQSRDDSHALPEKMHSEGKCNADGDSRPPSQRSDRSWEGGSSAREESDEEFEKDSSKNNGKNKERTSKNPGQQKAFRTVEMQKASSNHDEDIHHDTKKQLPKLQDRRITDNKAIKAKPSETVKAPDPRDLQIMIESAIRQSQEKQDSESQPVQSKGSDDSEDDSDDDSDESEIGEREQTKLSPQQNGQRTESPAPERSKPSIGTCTLNSDIKSTNPFVYEDWDKDCEHEKARVNTKSSAVLVGGVTPDPNWLEDDWEI